MDYKEHVIELIKACKSNIVFHPHAEMRINQYNLKLKEIKEKLLNFQIIKVYPNLNERRNFKADESFLIRLRHSENYIIEVVAYFYTPDKVLIATVYKINKAR